MTSTVQLNRNPDDFNPSLEKTGGVSVLNDLRDVKRFSVVFTSGAFSEKKSCLRMSLEWIWGGGGSEFEQRFRCNMLGSISLLGSWSHLDAK